MSTPEPTMESGTGRHARIVAKRACPLALLVTVAGGSFWLGSHSWSGSDDGGARLSVSANDLNFGEVWEQERFEWKVPVRNTSSEPIEVIGFTSSCSCVNIEPGSFVLASNESKLVKMTIDLSRSSQKDASSGSRETQISILPTINHGPVTRAGWTLRGRVKSAFVLTPALVDFGGDLIRGHSPPSGHVLLTKSVPLAAIGAEVDKALAAVEVLKVADKPGNYEIVLYPNPWMPAGAFAFTVALKAMTKEGAAIPPVPLRVRGRMKEEVEPAPSSLALGARRVGETVTETVVLNTLVNRAFEVLKSDVSSTSISLSPIQRGSGDQARYRVTWRISRVGQQTENVSFTVRSGGRTFTLPLPLDAYAY